MHACAESGKLSSGLHKESLQAAEKQVALMCELLKGVRVPLTLSMMQVCLLSLAPTCTCVDARCTASDLGLCILCTDGAIYNVGKALTCLAASLPRGALQHG